MPTLMVFSSLRILPMSKNSNITGHDGLHVPCGLSEMDSFVEELRREFLDHPLAAVWHAIEECQREIAPSEDWEKLKVCVRGHLGE